MWFVFLFIVICILNILFLVWNVILVFIIELLIMLIVCLWLIYRSNDVCVYYICFY